MLDFNLADVSATRCLPTDALVFYRGPDSTIVTHHDIDGGGVLGAGTAPDSEIVAALLRELVGQHSVERRLFPERLLYQSHSELLWWTEAQRRPMWFSLGKSRRKLLVPWPALVFHVREHSLRVVAIRESRRPDEQTRLFHAPLMNIYRDTRLCMGNIARPDCTLRDLPAWESTIYDTMFSHTNHDATLKWRRPPKDDSRAHYRFWCKLDKDRSDAFPQHRLNPLDMTLQEWFSDV